MSTNQHRRRSGIALGAAGIALAGSVLVATPASAHTHGWEVDCDSVTLDLRAYNDNAANTVTLTADGNEVINQEFGTNFREADIPLPKHSEPIEVRLVVDAHDDDGTRGWDFDQTKTSPVCEGDEPSPEPTPSTPSEEPTPSPEPSTSEPAEPTPSPSTSSPAPVEPADDESPAPTDLAETGASSSTPLIAGIAAAVVAAGAGLLLMVRKRRSAKA